MENYDILFQDSENLRLNNSIIKEEYEKNKMENERLLSENKVFMEKEV